MARVPQMRLPTVMRGSHAFARVPAVNVQRSTFDRSHGHKTAFNSGYLVPVYVDEALPGDTFNLSMTVLARLSTPLKPFMDNLYLESFFFFIPLRLIWTHFLAFMGEQDAGSFTAYTVPQFTAYNASTGSLSDYMGIPVQASYASGAGFAHTSLFHRAYNKVYNDWFRDENLVSLATVDMGDGPDAIANYTLRRRGKRHDYFTSCLPWTQKAGTVTLPLSGSANVIPNMATPGTTNVPNFTGVTSGQTGNLGAHATANPTGADLINAAGNWTAGEKLKWTDGAGPSNTGLITDLTSATATTINALRQAFQIQKFAERDARGGTRYTEKIHAHFGVVSPDARLQRSEYLGGGSSPLVISPVAQTAVTVGQTPLANLSGVGAVMAHGHGFSKSFTEHGILLGIVNVRADLTYQQGVNRMFMRSTSNDFYWPEYAHLGEQSVLNQEIWTQQTAADTAVFGYQERYAEYRYKPSLITGIMRSFPSGGATPVDFWHLSQSFSTLPALNQTFIEENPPISRVVAVTTEPQFYFDGFFKLITARPMPVFSVPGFIDHF